MGFNILLSGPSIGLLLNFRDAVGATLAVAQPLRSPNPCGRPTLAVARMYPGDREGRPYASIPVPSSIETV